jgi:hypothetical protein
LNVLCRMLSVCLLALPLYDWILIPWKDKIVTSGWLVRPDAEEKRPRVGISVVNRFRQKIAQNASIVNKST